MDYNKLIKIADTNSQVVSSSITPKSNKPSTIVVLTNVVRYGNETVLVTSTKNVSALLKRLNDGLPDKFSVCSSHSSYDVAHDMELIRQALSDKAESPSSNWYHCSAEYATQVIDDIMIGSTDASDSEITDGKIVDDVDLESLSSIKEKAEAIVNAYEFPEDGDGIFVSGDAVDCIESDNDLMSDPKIARLVERYRSLERRAYRNGDDYMVADFFDEKILPVLEKIAEI